MAALKVLVVVMGIAIVAMIALIGVTIVNRFSVATGGPSEIRLGLAPGEAIVGAVPGDGRLAVTVRDGQGAVRVLLLDLASGKPAHNILP